MTADLLQRTKDTTELVLQQSGVAPGTLDELVLVGGSTYMPVVEQMLREICQREPSRALAPERAVAEGAAIHAAILQARNGVNTGGIVDVVQKRLNSVKTTDVNSHSLGIKISDPKDKTRKINHIMSPKNSPIPHNVKQRFGTNTAGQHRIHVEILEGDAIDPAACELIGDFRITNLPQSLPKGSRRRAQPPERAAEGGPNRRKGQQLRGPSSRSRPPQREWHCAETRLYQGCRCSRRGSDDRCDHRCDAPQVLSKTAQPLEGTEA